MHIGTRSKLPRSLTCLCLVAWLSALDRLIMSETRLVARVCTCIQDDVHLSCGRGGDCGHRGGLNWVPLHLAI